MSQYEKIIKRMIRDTQKWWLPQDFMQEHPTHPLFVGYEASARLSELAKLYPEMIESEKQGKYLARRFNPTGVKQCYERLSIELKVLLSGYLKSELTLF